MTDSIVHAFSPQMNPDALTHDQLRREFLRQQEELFEKDLELVELRTQLVLLDKTAQRLDGLLTKVCELRLDNCWGDLYAEIDRMAEHYQQQKLRRAAEGVVH